MVKWPSDQAPEHLEETKEWQISSQSKHFEVSGYRCVVHGAWRMYVLCRYETSFLCTPLPSVSSHASWYRSMFKSANGMQQDTIRIDVSWAVWPRLFGNVEGVSLNSGVLSLTLRSSHTFGMTGRLGLRILHIFWNAGIPIINDGMPTWAPGKMGPEDFPIDSAKKEIPSELFVKGPGYLTGVCG